MDYVLAGATVNNCTLNIDQGTVLAFATPYYELNGRTEATRYWDRYALPTYEWGIRLNPGGRLNVNGVPTNRVTFARLEAVQENALFPAVWEGGYVPVVTFKGVITPNGTIVEPLAEAKVCYADFPTLAGWVSHFSDLYPDYTYDLVKSFELEGCHLFNGFLIYDVGGPSGRTIMLRNNVFERTTVGMGDLGFGHGEEAESMSVYNNLFYGCLMGLGPLAGSFTDNIFDHVSFNSFGGQMFNQVADNHHNAYVGMSTRLSPAAPTSTDPNLASLTYQTGPLGSFYLPSSASLLINQGSRTAGAAGLYHFTTQTSNSKEATSQVDIGPHYLSLSSNLPKDSNTDGVADFLADRNGNGSEGSDEIPWLSGVSSSLSILSPTDNSTVSGVIKVRVNFGNLGAGSPQPRQLGVRVDGQSPDYSTFVSTPAESIAEVEIDTRFLANGEHTLSAKTVFQTGSAGTAGQEFAISTEITVDVINDIRFPMWEDMSQVALRVNVETPNVAQDHTLWFFGGNYPISYDPSPISAVQGTSSGNISFTETLANLGYGDGSVDPSLYSVTELSSQNTATINPSTRNDPMFPDVGHWVVTYETDPVDGKWWYFDNTKTWDVLFNTLDPLDSFDARWIHDVQLGAWFSCGVLSGAQGSPLVAFPLSTDIPQTWPIRNKRRSTMDEELVRHWLGRPDVRNFYALAHGGLDVPLGIDATTAKHRFRFVFLDGCESSHFYKFTSFGASLAERNFPKTLGYLIDLGFPGNTGPMQISYYEDYLRPSAFLGWNVSWPISFPLSVYGKTAPQADPWTGLQCDQQIYSAIANWHRQVVVFWTLNNKTIVESLRDATQLAYVPGTGSGDLRVFSHIYVGPQGLIGPDRPEYYFDGPRENLVLYGHGGLKFNSWNHSADGVPTAP
ncbi:MAG TPA: hypothetical protein VFZ59_09175 [Verrucomicrobiae bacterium]|nr:hypothetical protein [Verrucomicrobiae bacterium]